MALVVLPRQFLADPNGTPRVGAKLYVYNAGTDIPRVSYTTPAYAIPHPSPVLSVANGLFPAVHVDPDGGDYKIVITDADDVPIYTEDNLPVRDRDFDAETVGETIYPRSQDEIAASITPQTFAYPPQHLWRYGSDPAGESFSDTAFQNAIAAQPTVNSANAQGVLVIPPGHYRMNEPLEIPCTMAVQADGAFLDWSETDNTAILNGTTPAITIVQTSQGAWSDGTIGDPLGRMTIRGPGNSTQARGIYINVSAPGGGFVTKFKIRVSQVYDWRIGLEQGNQSWNFYFDGGWFFRNHINVYFPSGLLNAAENIQFFNTILSEAVTASLRSYSNVLDINFYGGSIDYNTGYGVDVSGDTIVNFYGTHFEAGVDKVHIANVPEAGNPYVNCYACTFTAQEGSASNEIIDARNIHLTVHGGWVRIGGSDPQATFIRSTGAYDLELDLIGVLGTVTTMANITGGTGFKRIYAGGTSGSQFNTRPLRHANNVGLQGTESGGTARDLVKLNTTNAIELGSANNGVVIGGTTLAASALLQIDSTTRGVLFPRMTSTQRDAISSPTDGTVIYNTTTSKLQVRAGGAWVDLH